jgi:hypothetical protein
VGAVVRLILREVRLRVTVLRELLFEAVDFAATVLCVDATECARFRLCVAADA